MSLVIGVDVGGTKVLAAEVTPDGGLRRTARTANPGRRVDEALLEQAVTDAVLEVADGRRMDAVGVAAAGFVDSPAERVVFAPHLPWQGQPVRARLAQRWGTTVVLDNDANCAARAECSAGVARGADDVLLVTLGTGIGGAVVLGGRLHRGHHGLAGEFGHMQVVPDGLPCECGRRGCWEQYCSGNALVRFARARLGTQPSALRDACAGDPERLVGPMVTVAAEAGDVLARQAFASVGEWLGVGLANLVAAFDPELVVVGGGVSIAGDLLLEPARGALASSLVAVAHRPVPPVRRARFGPEAGVVGAADLARARLTGTAGPAGPADAADAAGG